MVRVILGVTGGIASGKSAVCQTLTALGAEVIDADAIARELTAPRGRALPEIRRAFGDNVFLADDTLDRSALAARVFGNEEALLALNAITHPLVRNEMQRRVAASDKQVVALDVPLLFETGMEDMANIVWCCVCPVETQIARAMARDGMTRAQALKRIASQLPTQRKAELSDAVIDTSGDIETTQEQVRALYARLPGQGDGA